MGLRNIQQESTGKPHVTQPAGVPSWVWSTASPQAKLLRERTNSSRSATPSNLALPDFNRNHLRKLRCRVPTLSVPGRRLLCVCSPWMSWTSYSHQRNLYVMGRTIVTSFRNSLPSSYSPGQRFLSLLLFSFLLVTELGKRLLQVKEFGRD